MNELLAAASLPVAMFFVILLLGECCVRWWEDDTFWPWNWKRKK